MKSEPVRVDLGDARQQFLSLFARTLELQVILLHSTEIDPPVVAREHAEFGRLLDQLARHPQQPHIQRYSELNRGEFVRAETDYLEIFLRTLGARQKRLCELLRMTGPDAPQHSIEDLTERMLEPTRVGAANQFTDAQRALVLRLTDASRYYGAQIGEQVFGRSLNSQPSADLQSRQASGADLESVSGAAHETDRATSPPTDETVASLLRMKAAVIADRLSSYRCQEPTVLALALLKVKQWLADPEHTVTDSTREGVDNLPRRRRPGPALEVCTSRPTDLLALYHSPNGSRALFHWGTTNETMHRLAAQGGLSLLAVPSCSLLLFSASGAVAGIASAASGLAGQTPLDDLALLIKRLDFSGEFLRLTAVGEKASAEAAAVSARSAELLRIAEEL